MEYGQLQSMLDHLGAQVGAAEAHGCLCGALCARAGFGTEDWLGELVEAPAVLDEPAGQALSELHDETLAELQAGEMGFSPLLPLDDAALDDRVAALAAWCGGFLYGVGTGAPGEQAGQAGDLEEILRDFGEISRARLDPEDAAEAAERAYADLYEFVRVGAQLAYDELAPVRAAQSRAGDRVH